MNLTLILLAIGNLLLLLGIRSLRTQRLKERYALLFVALGVPFLALAVWPDAVGYVAQRLGIEYSTVLLLTVTAFFLLMNFSLLSILSVQERRIICLTQIVAILSQEHQATRSHEKPPTAAPLSFDGSSRPESEHLKRQA